jgi:uncharacterized protein
MKQIFLLFFFLIASPFVKAQKNTPLILVDKISINSDILDENRDIVVHLPKGYDNCNEKYPVLFVFDTPSNFLPVIGVVDHLVSSYQSIPNMIVIGIENTYRNRDFINKKVDGFKFSENGGADKYIKHLQKELIPFIDSAYRTQDFRMVYGHSSSASFGAYLMANEPDLIDVCFAIDPAFWVDTTMLTDFLEIIDKSELSDNYFYFSHSRAGDMRMISANFTLFKDLEIKHSDKVNWDFKYYQTEDHFSIRLRSLYDGLENYFSDCKIPYKYLWYNDSENLVKHIESATDKYKINPLYPEKLLNGYAKSFIRNNDLNGALKLLVLNQSYYPNSSDIYYLIGQIYEKQGDNKIAIVNYKKSISLGSDKKLEDVISKLKSE